MVVKAFFTNNVKIAFTTRNARRVSPGSLHPSGISVRSPFNRILHSQRPGAVSGNVLTAILAFVEVALDSLLNQGGERELPRIVALVEVDRPRLVAFELGVE